MSQCSSCGTEKSLLFETDEGSLCWLCSSRKKAGSANSEGSKPDEEDPGAERRIWERFPVHIHVKLAYGTTEASKVIFPGTSVNISEGGMCIEWTPCEECLGYLPGEIHQNCIFAGYSLQREDSDTFYLSLFLSENDVINFSSKAVFVIKKEEDKEYIGISFVDIDENARKRIYDIIDKVTDNG